MSLAGGGEPLVDVQRLIEPERAGLSANWWRDMTAGRLRWSPEVWEIFGLDPDEPPDLARINALIHPDDRERVNRATASWQAQESGTLRVLYRIITPAGEQRLIEVRAWLEPNDIEAPPTAPARHAIGTIIDLTDAARLARERHEADEQREMVLRVSGDGICGVGRDGEVTFFNPAFRALARRGAAEIEGRNLHDLVHRSVDGSELHCAASCPYRADHEGRTREVDPHFVAGDGARLEVSYVRVAVREGGPIGAVISLRDATEQRAAARRLQASLEHVRELSAQRGALLRQLAAAEERERLRIAGDIHDDSVQTLRAVELTLERRRDQLSDPLAARVVQEARLDVHEAASRLRGLMLELLPPVPQMRLADAIAAYCQSQLEGTGLDYMVRGETAELDPDVYLLAYRLAQEAIRNARKHSRGSCVHVLLSMGASSIVVEVIDDGVGLAGEADGSGDLGDQGGLRIIRQRVSAAGGHAAFGPGPDGSGTRVRIELPLDEDWGT